MRQKTTKSMSTMFSSPVSIRLSARSSRAAPPTRPVPAERMPISMMFWRVTFGRRTSSIG